MDKKYKYIHLMPGGNSIFNIEFIKFVSNNFTVEDHLFVVFANTPIKDLERYSNVIYKNKFDLKTSYSFTHLADWIFLHGLCYSAWELIRMRRDFAEKIVWCVWGNDLYRFSWGDAIKESVTIKNVGRWLYARLLRFIWMFADVKIASFKAAIAGFESDRLELKKRFESVRIYNAVYVIGHFSDELDHLEKGRKEGNRKRILLGHCAYSFLKHEKYLDCLRKYADEDFELVIPLSYGNIAYANSIENIARGIFGNKVLILRDNKSWLEYAELINTIDVAIFDYEHQSALGNIFLLLYLKKKVYLSPSGIIYKGLINTGVGVYDCHEIGSVPFDQFIDNHLDSGNGVKYARRFFDKSELVSMWQNVFESL
ncbi:MAG: TDP-N-acetylfucosamine:lipid II N-acetylfucosaminyltransferase [Parabacteroides sp.]|nr:TDP-N-acetylfucosamine:lipid II N-acetylfucosaminyltransferase [Parabacteroides sp.]